MQNSKFVELVKLLNLKKENTNLTEIEKEKIKNLEYLLKDENLFFEIDFETAIGILEFLGIKEDIILDYYFSLISPSNFKKEDDFYITISNKR